MVFNTLSQNCHKHGKRLVLLAIALLMAVSVGLWAALFSARKTEFLSIQTKNGSYPLTIEVADSEEEQERGLMHRVSLEEGTGMLFYYPQDKTVRMWMKNTLIALDMLFIDSQGKIVYIARHAKPESLDVISADRPVRAVLEVAGGTAETYNIQVGDTVTHAYFNERRP